MQLIRGQGMKIPSPSVVLVFYLFGVFFSAEGPQEKTPLAK
jgi:hypothetical protein